MVLVEFTVSFICIFIRLYTIILFVIIGLSRKEEEELAQKLSMYNRILNEEVEILSNQTKKIQTEGFDIPTKVMLLNKSKTKLWFKLTDFKDVSLLFQKFIFQQNCQPRIKLNIALFSFSIYLFYIKDIYKILQSLDRYTTEKLYNVKIMKYYWWSTE